MTLVVISVLGLGLMGTTASTLKQSDSERIDQSVFYIAESGVVQKKEELNKVLENTYYCAKNHFVPSDKATAEENVAAFYNYFYSLAKNEIVKYTPSISEHVNSTPCNTHEANPAGAAILGIPKNVDSNNYEIYNNYESHSNVQPLSKVKVKKVSDSPLKYSIQSKGTIGNKSRTVLQEYEVSLDASAYKITQGNYLLSDAIQVKGTINLSGNSKVDGTVSNPSGKTINNKANATVLKKEFPTSITFPNSNNFNNQTSLIVTSDSDSLDLTKNSIVRFNSLELIGDKNNGNGKKDKGEAVINVGNNENIIYVNSLTLSGKINIIGNGHLTIYVKDTVNMNKTNFTSISNNNDPTKLTIFYNNTPTLDTGNKLTYYGLLVAPNAEVSVEGSGNDYDIVGGILANSYTTNGANIRYAKTAPVSTENAVSNTNPNKFSILGDLTETTESLTEQ